MRLCSIADSKYMKDLSASIKLILPEKKKIVIISFFVCHFFMIAEKKCDNERKVKDSIELI